MVQSLKLWLFGFPAGFSLEGEKKANRGEGGSQPHYASGSPTCGVAPALRLSSVKMSLLNPVRILENFCTVISNKLWLLKREKFNSKTVNC